MNTAASHNAAYRLNEHPFDGWTALWSPDLNRPVFAFGQPVPFSRSSDPAEALNWMMKAAGSSADFIPMTTYQVKGLTRAFYREQRSGLPVLGGRADIVLNNRGELMRWTLRSHDHWPTMDGHYLGLSAAALVLAGTCANASWAMDSERSFAAWYPEMDMKFLRPVYWITIRGEKSHERWEGLVDAVSGEVILNWPGIRTDVLSGVIQGQYWQPYMNSPVQVAPHPFETLRINGASVTTNASGVFSREAGGSAILSSHLTSPYFDVLNDDAARGELNLTLTAPYAPLTWEWTTANAARPELNLFHHTAFIHHWYKMLDPGFTALDYPMPVVANYGDNYDNAFWNGDGMYFGSGGQYSNFAMFSDIIYHEYTHGVTDGIYPWGSLPYIDQPGALNEAWSDYIASTINGDPYMAEYIMQNSFNTYFRCLDNDLVYPRDWFGEVHYDSRFVSAALWEIREALGAAITDSLMHFSRYGLAESFIDYLQAVLETDDNDGDLTNGTPHSAVIYHAFGRHGIGPGDLPNFDIQNLSYYANGTGGSAGDGDRFFEPGETIEMTFQLANTSQLFPPPATNVQITLASNDPHLTVVNGVQSVAQLAPGQTYTATPVQFQISSAAQDNWSVVSINVVSNGGAATMQDTLEFMIGLPSILIVEDDPVTDVEHFVSAALHSRNHIYEKVPLESGQSLPTTYLPDNGLVIWISGDASGTILTMQDQTNLRNYLTAGGCVVLTGQNIADALHDTPFAEQVLQVDIEADSLHSYAVSSTGAPFAEGDWFLITGSAGAANQYEETSFIPFGSSREIARYGRTGTGPIAAVEFAGGRGLLFGFGLEAVSGMAAGSLDLPAIMDRINTWAGHDSVDSSPDMPAVALPVKCTVGPAYPNPFNATTMIRYSIPEMRGGELVMYNIAGRVVDVLSLSDRSGSVAWTPAAASGVYFAQARWNGGQTTPIKLLLLK